MNYRVIALILFNLILFIMAKSALTRPKVALSVDRSAADVSGMRLFNTHAGYLDMVYCEPFIKGSKGVINRKTFTRSAQVLYPAFVGVKEYFDFFKVPIRYLWSRWLDWDLNINDANSSYQMTINNYGQTNQALPSNVPYCDFAGVGDIIPTLFNGNEMPGHTSLTSVADKMTMCTNALRLLDRAGIKLSYRNSDGSSTVPNAMNLFKLAAYQKIYYDHYRNTTYESNDPYAYNLDWLYSGGYNYPSWTEGKLDPYEANSAALHKSVLKRLLTGRYVNWQNDFFHNIYPALNYVSSSPSGLSWSVPSSVVWARTASGVNALQPDVNAFYGDGGQVGIGNSISMNGSYQVTSSYSTVQQIRAAFALDKLMRASAYAPKHVRDQIKARFGVDVGDKVSYESERLGSFVSDVNFGEVTQTVDTSLAGDPSNLGSVGGKGVGASDWGKDLHFYCEEDCLIVGIHYFIPSSMYDAVQDEWNQKLIREDFFQPEFQNLGLRPVLRKNIVPYLQFGSSDGTYLNDILGYTVPNQLYKVGKNLNFGLFNSSYMKYQENSGTWTLATGTSPLSAFTTHANKVYRLLSSNWSVTWEYFKVLPNVLDPLMAQSFDGTYDTDQFIGLCRLKVAKVHPMDVHGQPSL